MLKTFDYHSKPRIYTILKPRGGVLTPRANKKSNNVKKNFKQLEKNCAKQYKFAGFWSAVVRQYLETVCIEG